MTAVNVLTVLAATYGAKIVMIVLAGFLWAAVAATFVNLAAGSWTAQSWTAGDISLGWHRRPWYWCLVTAAAFHEAFTGAAHLDLTRTAVALAAAVGAAVYAAVLTAQIDAAQARHPASMGIPT